MFSTNSDKEVVILWFAPQTYKIGWVEHPAYHRQSYATEAAAALLVYGFEERR